MFDGDLLIQFDATAKDSWFGMKFKTGYVAVLDKVKYYVPGENLKSYYINNTVLQGTNDDWTTVVDIYTVEDTVSSGWNYVNFEDPATKPKYNQYRWYGKDTNSVRLTEV